MNKLVVSFIFLFISSLLVAQTNISGTVNSYASIQTIDTSTYSVTSAGANSFSAGDLVLLIQMQGTEIDESLSNSFGTITNYKAAGQYELQRVCNRTGNNVYFQNPFMHPYDPAGRLQIIRIPEYANGARLNDSLTGQSWNGSTGGVVALKVNGQLDLNSFRITMNEKGFRGGEALPSGGGCIFLSPSTQYTSRNSTNDRALKGEGIAAYIVGKECSRGPQANGGGGGNNHNGGGCGGSNYGIGGAGGQRVKSSNFSCGSVVGLDSKSLSAEINNGRVFMGGGGGAGHGNNAGFDGEHGKQGGGIVIIMADEIIGTNRAGIYANGGTGVVNSENEGGGGAGAGGSVILDVNSISSPITISAKGGGGTFVTNFGTNCSGPGGGGGGGFIAFSGNSIPTTVNTDIKGGAAGEIASSSQSGCNVGDKNGAVDGTDGVVITNYALFDNIPIQIAEKTVSSCSTYTSPSGKHNWDQSGEYLDTIINPAGCEKITRFTLTIESINDSVVKVNSGGAPSLKAVESPANYQWIDCETNELFSDTNQVFSPAQTGYYAAIVTKNGCTDTSACFSCVNVSTLELASENDILLAPNPSEGNFTITSVSKPIIKAAVYSLEGRLIKILKPNETGIIESELEEKGIYLLKIKSEGGSTISKLIVQ